MSHIVSVTLQTIFTLLWVGWIGLFLVIEAAAIALWRKFDDKNDTTKYDGGTLSTFVWRLIKRHALIFFVFTLFWSWLTFHFLFEF